MGCIKTKICQKLSLIRDTVFLLGDFEQVLRYLKSGDWSGATPYKIQLSERWAVDFYFHIILM